jgi:hypothetical protein
MKEQRYLPINMARKFFKEKKLDLEITEMKIERGKIYKNYGKKGRGIYKGLIIHRLEKLNLLNEFFEKYWKNGRTDDGKRTIQRYKSKYAEYTGKNGAGSDEDEENNSYFTYEKDLQIILAKNLNVIEDGMILYKDKEGKTGIEYPIEGKRIDVLALDKNNIPVIIELKAGRGHEKVVGQCQFYKNAIKKLFKVEKARVIIITKEITEYLKTATMDMSEYELFEYDLNIKLIKVK